MSPAAPLRAGQIVAEKYRIVELVGTGGMGVVFAAVHLDLDRRVALKVMRTDAYGDEEAVTRFMREARTAARLEGPHVAKVLDVGRLESGAPYLVMELLKGQNLQSLVAESGPLPVEEAADYLLEACEALAEAHGAGVVHRDLKPANLFLTRDAYGESSIKVLDFGISKCLNPGITADPGLTDSRTMMGSPAYMSPEQMRSSRNVDHRTDIWGLGTALFELVTGRVAWSGDSLSEVCVQVASDPAPSIRQLVPSAPGELDAIVARCLEKRPERRYQHVADLAVAVSPFASPRGRVTLERVLRISGHGKEHAATTATRLAAFGSEPIPAVTAAADDAGPGSTLLSAGSSAASSERSAPVEPPPAEAAAKRPDAVRPETFRGTATTRPGRLPRRSAKLATLGSVGVGLLVIGLGMWWQRTWKTAGGVGVAGAPNLAASAPVAGPTESRSFGRGLTTSADPTEQARGAPETSQSSESRPRAQRAATSPAKPRDPNVSRPRATSPSARSSASADPMSIRR
jgi:serine/threonine protein kinase